MADEEARQPPPQSSSSLSSAPSTPASFHTAGTGAGLPNDTVTDYNTPPPLFSQSYKISRMIPQQARGRIRIYLEDKNYPEALTSLRAFLAPGLPDRKRVFVPPGAHLAFIANLAIHPTFTNKLCDTTWNGVAQQSLDYLRSLLDIAGPLNAPFASAFRFRRLTRHKRSILGGESEYEDLFESDIDKTSDRIRRNPIATTSSIWARGADFWSVVGWAMTCSFSHPTRWPFWKQWLDLVLDMLERDWAARKEADSAASESANDIVNYKRLQDSILQSYMDTEHMHLHGITFAMDAILVGLVPGPARRFDEVFYKETIAADNKRNKRKHCEMRVDVEKEMYGGYVDDDDDDDYDDGLDSALATHTRSGRRTGMGGGGLSGTQPTALPITAGALESITLRLRLFNLISASTRLLSPSETARQNFDNIHMKAAKALKQCQFSILQQFLDPISQYISRDSQALIASLILEAILPGTAKKPHVVDSKSSQQYVVSQSILEQCYLPHAAISEAPAENARLSIILEHMIQTLWHEDRLQYSEELRQAVEAGVSARESKAQGKGRKKRDTEPIFNESMVWLNESGERLMTVLEILEGSQGEQ